MKTLNKILLVLVLVFFSVFHAQAQYNDPFPTAGFSSTSSGAFNSGSAYSSAAVTGVMCADDYYNTMSPSRSGIRKGRVDDEEIGDVDDPTEVDVTPIGDGLWILLIMAAGYLIYRRKKQINMKQSFTNRALATAIALTMSIGLWAVPAKPGWRTMTQPDGSTIKVELRGDEFYHYWADESGQEVQQDANGYWQVVGTAPTGSQVMARRSASPIRRTIIPRQVGSSNTQGKGLVILVNFQDKTMSNSLADMTSMITGENYTYNGAVGSVRQYFYDQSNGQYNPQFDVVGPVTVSNNRSYYGNKQYARVAAMVNEACSLVNSQVDFSQYDSDKDGVVDFVYIVYAKGGAADGGPAESIWPHSWDLASAGISASSRRYDNKYIKSYACSPELVGGDNGSRATVGTFCHEFSHVIGMPDYYDIDYGENYKNNATPGEWTIMDQGNYNENGNCPPNYSTFDKYFMGWLTPENLGTSAKNVTLQYLGHKNGEGVLDGVGYQLNAAGSVAAYSNTGDQYYLENRQQTGWDKGLPGHGMLLWKVQYNSSAWSSNGPNDTDGTIRYGVVAASGATTSIGTSSDPFPGTKKKTSWTAVSGREIINIAENTSAKTVSFTYIEDPGCHNVVLAATNCTINPSANCVSNGTALTATITPKGAAWDISSVTIMRGSTNITSSCTISQDKQSVTIPAEQVTGDVTYDITITATATQTRWAYSLDGDNIKQTDAEGAVDKNGQLQLAITPIAGYIINSAEHLWVVMGDDVLTWGTDYTYSDGVLTIPSVTGDLMIVAYPVLDPESNYTFIPLTNISQIVAGAKIVLVGTVAQGGSGVQTVTTYLAGPISSAYLTAVTEGYTINGEAILVPKTTNSILVFDIAGSSNNWTLTNGSNQLRASSSAVYMGGSTGTNTWEIGVNSLQTTDNYAMYFNAGSPRFKTYSSAQAEVKIYITQTSGGELPTPVITFEKSADLTCHDGETFQNIASSTYGTVTYNSSDPTNAPVDALGIVRPTATGSYTITAAVEATDYYKAAQAQYTLVVTAMPTCDITWIAKGVSFAGTSVRQGDGLVLPNTTPSACDNGKVFVGWSTESNYNNATTAPTCAKDGDAVAAATTYYAIYAVESSGSGGTSVASHANPFTSVNGDLDENISYAASQGGAGTAPVVANNGDLRIYQKGGLLTLSATKDGIQITGVSIKSSQATSVQYKIKNGSYSTSIDIAENGTFLQEVTATDEVTIKCTGTNSDSRLNISYLAVSYTGGTSGKVYTQFSTGCGEVEKGKKTPAWTLTDASTIMYVGENYTNTVNNQEGGLTLSYSSSDPTVASVNASTGQVTALKAGNTTITVSTAGTDDYFTKSLTYSVSVVKAIDGNVSFDITSKTMTIGATATQTVAKAMDNTGTIVYSSSAPNVASVDAASGEVTALTPGTATITANITATTKYEAAQASYTVTVEMGAYDYMVTWTANGQTYLTQYYHSGDALVLPAETPACDGKTFQGWTATRYYLDPFNAPSDMFTTAESKTVTSNITYYAIFK